MHTGDIARIDENGFIFIVDRKKDMVLRGGENVYCAEVEATVYRHAAVAECCVFGVADERLGEEVGGGVFPLSEYATEESAEEATEESAEEAAKWAYEDALAEASAWLASR